MASSQRVGNLARRALSGAVALRPTEPRPLKIVQPDRKAVSLVRWPAAKALAIWHVETLSDVVTPARPSPQTSHPYGLFF